jgi:hypothetical protein
MKVPAKSFSNNQPKKKVIQWTLHCENPIRSWVLVFDSQDKFDRNYEERCRWGECSGVTLHYEDGTKKKRNIEAWGS